MAMCAGVQKVSRPTVSCHEMSQVIPMAMLLRAAVISRLGQKLESRVSPEPDSADRTLPSAKTEAVALSEIVSMLAAILWAQSQRRAIFHYRTRRVQKKGRR